MMRRLTTPIVLAATMAAFIAPSVHATPADDPASIVTIQVENDAVSTLRGTSDQYYTSGLRLGYVSPTGAVPGFLAGLGHGLWGDGVQRVSLNLEQSLFTPRDTQLSNPAPTDRPYAGVLGLNGQLIQDTDTVRNVLSLELGVLGPSALGRQVQNGFHSIIGDTPNRGWSTQLHDEPIVQITPERTWRVPLGNVGPVSFDALPSLTVGLGSLRDYAMAGVVFRMGQGLDSDFGVSRIQPGISGTDAYHPTRPIAWYVFGGADAQAVGYDATLEQSPYYTSRSVSQKWDVGEVEVGVAVMMYGVRVTYTQVWQTEEFTTQKAGWFSFGSLAASVRF
jgi:lipid A 3-O-deacylase